MMTALLEPITRQRTETRLSPRPIRVSFVIDNLSRAGTESQLLALIRSLDRRDVQPSLVLLDGENDLSRSLEPADCPVLRLGVRRLTSPRAAQAAFILKRYWHLSQPDLVQTYFLDSTYFGVALAKAAGVPKIIRVRNNLGYWLTRRHRLLNRCVRPFVDQTLTNSTDGREALMQMDGLAPDRIAVIENGVDLDRFTPPNVARFNAVPHRLCGRICEP